MINFRSCIVYKFQEILRVKNVLSSLFDWNFSCSYDGEQNYFAVSELYYKLLILNWTMNTQYIPWLCLQNNLEVTSTRMCIYIDQSYTLHENELSLIKSKKE